MEHFVKIDGGIGRCIAATGAVREFAKDKKVYVVTGYDFVFDGLENVERTLVIGTKGIEEKILQGDYQEPEPYNSKDYYLDEKHLCQVFNKILNGKDEMVNPVINLTENEMNEGRNIVEQQRKSTGKGLVLVQPWSSSGGMVVADGKINVDETYRSFTLESFNKLCDKLLVSGYMPFIIKLPNQIGHEKSMTFTQQVNPRVIMSMIPYVDGIITVDSFLHHASSALGSPSPTIVFWGGTSEKNLSYKEHENIRERECSPEPNRIPHDHFYYIQKNKGCNKWSDEAIDLAISKLRRPVLAECNGCK